MFAAVPGVTSVTEQHGARPPCRRAGGAAVTTLTGGGHDMFAAVPGVTSVTEQHGARPPCRRAGGAAVSSGCAAVFGDYPCLRNGGRPPRARPAAR